MSNRVSFYLDIIENFDSKKPIRRMPEGIHVVYSSRDRPKNKYTKDKPMCAVAYYKDEAIVWFRGTRVYSVCDLRIDFSCSDTPFLDGMCHSGFLESTRRVIDDILPYIVGKKEVVFIGHSLGGACASLAALILRLERNWTNVHALTLACPGIVTKNIADNASPFITAYIRKYDPIPVIFNFKKIKTLFSNSEIDATYVPGRIFFLDRERGTVSLRKPKARDMILTPLRSINFIAHTRRFYMTVRM